MTTVDNVESRLGRIEGAYEHVATKADIERLDGKIDRLGAKLEAKIDGLQNRLLIQFTGIATGTVVATVGLTKLLTLIG